MFIICKYTVKNELCMTTHNVDFCVLCKKNQFLIKFCSNLKASTQIHLFWQNAVLEDLFSIPM